MARTEIASKMYTNNHGYRWALLVSSQRRSPVNYFPPLILYPFGGGNRSRSLRTNARVTPRKSGAPCDGGRLGREHGRERKTRSVTQNDPREAATATTVSPGAARSRNASAKAREPSCVHTRRPWVIVIAFKLSLALIANNIRAVSPSLFSLPGVPLSGLTLGLPLFLSASPLLPSSLSSHHADDFGSSFRERAPRRVPWTFTDTVATHPGTRHPESLLASSLLLVVRARSHMCGTKVVVFAGGIHTAVATFVRRCRQKGA